MRFCTSPRNLECNVWAYAGNPFGEQQPTSSTGYVLNLRYPGQYYDAESGLVSNGFRDCYEPATGRYCESDPTGLDGGISPMPMSTITRCYMSTRWGLVIVSKELYVISRLK